MNKIHRVVWNRAKGIWQAAQEGASSRAPSLSLSVSVSALLSLASPAFGAAPVPTELPTGGVVASGSASISQAGSQMTINQSTDKAILNWNTFNIGSQASVTFNQPSSGSIALNRVLGSDPSSIFGTLSANGQVFLINPNGILFGSGAKIDAQGLVASTMNLADSDFLNGNYRFTRDGSTGSVENDGAISAKYIALLAPSVINSGVLSAPMGSVALASGEAVTLGITGQDTVNVQVDPASVNALIENKGLIVADSGTVILSAQAASDLLGQVVNTGSISADSVSSDGGSIVVSASSSIANTGSISADAGTAGNGGHISLISDLSNPNGSTLVGGTLSAQGGSDSGDGGFIETSGHSVSIDPSASVSTSAPHGKIGNWLLDPIDFTIAAFGGDITGAQLSADLANNNVTISTSGGTVSCTGTTCGAGSGTGGDIFVNDAITWDTGMPAGSGGTTLTLQADRNIIFNADVSIDMNNPMSPGGDNLAIQYGMAGSGYALIAQGHSISTIANIADLTTGNSLYVNGSEAASMPFLLGAKAVSAFVGLTGTLSSVYGETPSYSYNFYLDSAGTQQVGLYGGAAGTPVFGNATTSLSSASNAGTYSVYYKSGLSNTVAGGGNNIALAGLSSTQTWSITQRPITITATTGQSKIYGNADPASFAYSLQASGSGVGWVNSDTFSGSLTRAAGENVGSYAIQQGTLNNSNYAITFVSNPFAITPRPITITVDPNQSKIYGNPDPAFTYTPQAYGPNVGLVSGDTLNGSLTRAVGENVGTYSILQGTIDNAHNPNYNIISFTGNSFGITPRPITFDANPVSIPYDGSLLPSFSATPSTTSGLGLAPGDTASDVYGTLTTDYSYPGSVPSLTYLPMQFSIFSGTGPKSGNYTTTFNGTNALTVIYAAPAPVTVVPTISSTPSSSTPVVNSTPLLPSYPTTTFAPGSNGENGNPIQISLTSNTSNTGSTLISNNACNGVITPCATMSGGPGLGGSNGFSIIPIASGNGHVTGGGGNDQLQGGGLGGGLGGFSGSGPGGGFGSGDAASNSGSGKTNSGSSRPDRHYQLNADRSLTCLGSDCPTPPRRVENPNGERIYVISNGIMHCLGDGCPTTATEPGSGSSLGSSSPNGNGSSNPNGTRTYTAVDGSVHCSGDGCPTAPKPLPFLNSLPLFLGDINDLPADMDIRQDTPGRLNITMCGGKASLVVSANAIVSMTSLRTKASLSNGKMTMSVGCM